MPWRDGMGSASDGGAAAASDASSPSRCAPFAQMTCLLLRAVYSTDVGTERTPNGAWTTAGYNASAWRARGCAAVEHGAGWAAAVGGLVQQRCWKPDRRGRVLCSRGRRGARPWVGCARLSRERRLVDTLRTNGAAADPAVFSFHDHVDRCTGAAQRVPIEPLTVGDRDESLAHLTLPRVGEGRGGRGWAAAPTARAHARYALGGVVFDRIVAWEAVPVDRAELAASIPRGVMRRLTFHNHPVDAGSGGRNPWAAVRALVRPSDYVAVKLDIDTWRVERALVSQLTADPALQRLVDEFFWEDHVRGYPLEFMWQWEEEGIGPDTLAEAHARLARLRRAGIRAHAWI
eukprot:gene25890-34856_t